MPCLREPLTDTQTAAPGSRRQAAAAFRSAVIRLRKRVPGRSRRGNGPRSCRPNEKNVWRTSLGRGILNNRLVFLTVPEPTTAPLIWLSAGVRELFAVLPISLEGADVSLASVSRLHVDRAVGGDRDHRDPDRPAPARRPEGPGIGRPGQVFQQPAPVGHCLSLVP